MARVVSGLPPPPLALVLVMIVCVGSSIALKCYVCGDRNQPKCDANSPGDEMDCPANEKVCNTQYLNESLVVAKMCQTEDLMNEYKNHADSEKRDGSDDCYGPKTIPTARHCFCTSDLCNGKANGGGGGGGGGKGSSSMTNPSLWTNLLWIGLVLASPSSSRMRPV